MADEGGDEDTVEQSFIGKQPQYPFDVKETDVIIDVRCLCGLPEDPEADGMESWRAVFLPKGKTIHVPEEPGAYVTLGPYRSQLAISIVHFASTTARDPELLLGFVDHGMMKDSAIGIYVKSLQLPLCKQRNIYNEQPRYTKIADVSGFTDIDVKEQPWCAHLEGALARQPNYELNKLYSPALIIKHLHKALNIRLKDLMQRAQTGIDAKVSALARQDPRAAEKAKAQMLSTLDATKAWLDALPPSKYDRRLKDRITVVDADAAGGVSWLTTPRRAEMQKGEAQCQPTARRAVRQPSIDTQNGAAKSAPAAAPAAAGSALPEVVLDSEDPSSDTSIEIAEGSTETGAVGKRKRTPTAQFAFEAAAKKIDKSKKSVSSTH